jgi:hypothetical protein
MLENATLSVLAEAAEIGLPEAATVPAAAYDPFFRSVLKRRVRAAVETATTRARPNAPPDHVLRLAFLALHPSGPKNVDPNDDRAVEEAYEKLSAPFLPPRKEREERKGGAYRAGVERDPAAVILDTPPKRKRRFWPVTTSLVLAIIVSGLVTAGIYFVPFLIPSPIARFRGTPMGTVMGDPLTDLVVDGRRVIDHDTRVKILAPAVKKQIGPEAFDSLETAIDLVAPAASSEAATTDEAMAPLFAAVNRVDDALLRAKVPVLLHAYGSGQPGRRGIWLTSWFVDRRDEVKIGGEPLRVAWGRRLDSLNLLDNTIYKANAEDWATLAIELVEEEFVQQLLSPIAVGSPLGPDSFDDRDKSAAADLARAATPIVSAEIVRASGLSKSDADGLRRAIARRNEAAIGLGKMGYRVEPSSRIELSPNLVRGLTRARERNPNDGALLDELLHMNERMSIYRASVTPAIAELARIEEEEFAARVILDKRYETKTFARLGNAGSWRRSRAIAASELALIAAETTAPRLALWRIGHSLFARKTDEVVGIVLEALFRELDLLPKTDTPDFMVDDSFLRALQTSLKEPPERTRAAAAKVYQAIFEEPPPAMTRRSVP